MRRERDRKKKARAWTLAFSGRSGKQSLPFARFFYCALWQEYLSTVSLRDKATPRARFAVSRVQSVPRQGLEPWTLPVRKGCSIH